MTERTILNAMGEIDDRFIAEAAPAQRRKRTWYRWAAAAACLVLLLGLLALPAMFGTTTGGRYKNVTIQGSETALVLRWEDKTMDERYTSMGFDGRDYRTRSLAISQELLGEKLGSCEATGYDIYTDHTYQETFDVFEIAGIQNEKLVAVAMEGAYYVFLEDGYAPPATLGGLLEIYNLAEHLPLTRFSYDDAYYALEADAPIWQILGECADAPVVDDDNSHVNGKYLSFTATSEVLGIYKRVFYVTADGYVKTNALDHGYVYFIGEEAAGRILDYALANAAETDPEPYEQFVAGTITEIGEGYILISDAIMCRNEKDGMTFKILTQDPKFYRWMKYHDFQVGDVVYVRYRGQVEEGNVISGAYAISEAMIRDGDVLVQE